ncbi:hypothetical protein COLO4_14033 [Corchorus olitorius]|uniref:Protein kinase domain-containing protein n=1 Tax=Corchorus olitorius TaxID=93759 RepID=A0A1R3JUA9_9ROSI|nr:hypothetical protein COLO4_14033 [Corchorus olitorius]
MGNCFQSRSKVDNSLSSQATSGVSKFPSKNHVSASSNLTKADSGKSIPENRSTARTESDILSCPHLKAFTYAELRNATRNFRSDNLIGEGGFGYVYKGWLDEQTLVAARPGCGIVVAVKKLKPEGFQGHKEWLSEVDYLGGARPLSWAIRIRVAMDAARGLAFLHDSEQPIIYRDFKASNILLDSDFNAKLSDFGLAKAGPTGRLTARCDVYSFGVVLLELLSGRRAVDKTKVGVEENLVDWAKPYLRDRRKLFRIMDTKLEGQYPQRAASTVAILALQCISEAKVRPRMAEVLSALEELPTHPSQRDIHVSSPHSDARSPLRNSYPTSPVNMSHRGSSLPFEMKLSSNLKSPRERKSFEMKSPRNVKSPERKSFEMKSHRNVKSLQELKSPCHVKSPQEQLSSKMRSPHHVKSPQEQLSSKMRNPHHVSIERLRFQELIVLSKECLESSVIPYIALGFITDSTMQS